MADERIEALEGYEDMMLEMLAALPPELRLKGPAPEQIVAGLCPGGARAASGTSASQGR